MKVFLKNNRLILCFVFIFVGLTALVSPKFARKLAHNNALAERLRVSGMIDDLHK